MPTENDGFSLRPIDYAARARRNRRLNIAAIVTLIAAAAYAAAQGLAQ